MNLYLQRGVQMCPNPIDIENEGAVAVDTLNEIVYAAVGPTEESGLHTVSGCGQSDCSSSWHYIPTFTKCPYGPKHNSAPSCF